MNLAQLLAAKDDDSPGLTDEQIITRLSEYFALVHATEPERFEPGQIVWHKYPAMAYSRDAGKPNIFLGYLDAPIRGVDLAREPGDLGSMQSAMVLDVRILAIQQDAVAPFLADSRTLTATKRA